VVLSTINLLNSKFAQLKLDEEILKLAKKNKEIGTLIQSFLFDKKKYSVEKAKAWLKKHKYKIGKLFVTDNYIRFRQINSDKLKKYKLRTKEIGPGIKTIIASNPKQKNSKFSCEIKLKKVSKLSSYIKSENDIQIPMQAFVKILCTGQNRDGIIRRSDLENRIDTFGGKAIIDWHNKQEKGVTSYKITDKVGFINSGSERIEQDIFDNNKYWIVADATITDRYLAYLAYLGELRNEPLQVSAEFGWIPEMDGSKIYQTRIRPQLLTITENGEAEISDSEFKIIGEM